MNRGYFEQQNYEAEMAERDAFRRRLYGEELQVSEISRPIYQHPNYVYREPKAIPVNWDGEQPAGQSIEPTSEVQNEKGEEEIMGTSTELAVYSRIADPMSAVQQLGTAIAKSKLFGAESEAQGQVLALECISRGIPPLALAERYHVVDGKLMMRYDAMLAEFNNAGGKHRIVSRTPDKAEIELTLDGQKYSESYTWEEAQEDRLPFGKEDKIKKNWSTPRGRKQMLWARVVSEAVRALLPGVNCGRYAPEELGEEAPPANGKAKHEESDVVDGEFQVVNGSPAVAVVDVPAATSKKATPTGPTACTAKQSTRINELFAALQLTDEQRTKALAKRNANVVRNLTNEAATELIAALESKLAQVSNAIAGESQQPTDAVSWPSSGPCSIEQVNAIKQQMVQLQDPAIVEQVKKHLAANGKARIADLTVTDADTLLKSLEAKNLAAFIGKTLVKVEQLQPVAVGEPSKN